MKSADQRTFLKRDRTDYSQTILGSKGNYGRAVYFDYSDGYIGITQLAGSVFDRVLLSPAQYRALAAFVAQCAPRPRKKVKR